MRPSVAALLLLVASQVLSGCSAPKADTDDVPVVVDASGTARKDEAPSDETVQTPEGTVAVNKGLLAGRVHDAANFSIAGASVDVLGTELHTATTFQGTFRFLNVTPGVFDVRVEAAGFKPQEKRVTITAGAEVVLDVEMALKDGLDPGLAPHIHDYWGDDTTWRLMDDVVLLPERVQPQKSPQFDLLRGNNNEEWPFVLPEQEEGKPSTIWPGTAEVRFTLSWGTELENDIPRATVLVKSPLMEAPIDLGGVGNGGTLTYKLTSANETDIGHRLWTKWSFWLNIVNTPQGSTTAYRPTLATDGITVQVDIVKGDLVLELAHQDFWAANETLRIGDPKRPDYQANTGAPPARSDQTTEGIWVFTPHRIDGAVNIVPPQTGKLQVRFSWTHPQGPLPFTYHLTYRTPEMHPVFTPAEDYKVPTRTLEESATHVLYEIDVAPGEVDGFYEPKSGWGFKWHLDDNAGYQTGYPVKFQMVITAFKAAEA